MLNKMTMKTLVAALGILALSSLVVATLVYHEDSVPANPGGTTSRFWTSGTGFVTLTNNDSLYLNGSVTSVDISLSKDVFSDAFRIGGIKENKSICSEIYLIGDYIKPSSYPTPCPDSVEITAYYVDASGEDMHCVSDTCVFDTVGLVGLTSPAGLPFIFRLSVTEPEGNAFIGATMRFKMTIIDAAPAADSLFLDNCGILRRWTN